MTVAGIDIGSRTIALVELNGAGIRDSRIVDTGYDPLKQCLALMEGKNYDQIVATGYGRHLARANFATTTITEIKAFALGARVLVPGCRTVLDIGGQDTKVISLGAGGEVKNFEMNDKCAAGTGKFLEVMSGALGYHIEELGDQALSASGTVKINSMCTVFAESEVISLTTRGEDRRNIAHGLHQAIVERTLSMMRRVGVEGEMVFAGGVANNSCVCQMLEYALGITPIVTENPQLVGALGAALHAANSPSCGLGEEE